MNDRKKYLRIAAALSAIAAGCLFARMNIARAAGLVVTPAVIDDKGVPNDILQHALTVTNTGGTMENVFASVYNLTASGTQEFVNTSVVDASLADKSVSLANWIDVSRGAMLFAPGETKTIPVTINVSPFAAAGTYHAVIAFVEGGTRADAETHLDGAPQSLVDLVVRSNAVVRLELESFASTKPFVSSFPVTFSYALKNTGTAPATPVGRVIFYDKVGRELGSVDANPNQVTISPGDTQNFTTTWGNGQGFGQYKAMLDVTYGSAEEDQLQNVALVWVLPWRELALWFAGLLAVVVAAASWLHGLYERRRRARDGFVRTLLARLREGGGNERGVVDLHGSTRTPLDLRTKRKVPHPPEKYDRHAER